MRNRQSFGRVLRGLMAAYLVSAGCLLLLSLALWKWHLSEMAVNGVMIGIYVISTLAGGFYLGKKQREKKFLWGILLGFSYIFLLLFANGVMNGPTGLISKETLTVAAICVLGGMLGGMIS